MSGQGLEEGTRGASLPVATKQRKHGQLGYYSDKHQLIANTEIQISISYPLAL